MCISSVQTFFPTSRTSFKPVFASGKRYRNTFNDKRLANRHTELVKSMVETGKYQIKRLSTHRNQEIAFGRFLANDSVELSEVVHENTKIGADVVKGACLMLLLDISNINLSLNGKGRKSWKKLVGVIGTKNTPGLFILPCLVMIR